MPILTSFGGMTSSPTSFHILERSEKMIGISNVSQARKTNRIDEFSEKGQADKFPLKNGDLFT